MIRILAPTLLTLRDRWRPALLIVLLGAMAVGILLPGRSLARRGNTGDPALELPAIASAGPALMWAPDPQSPASTQAKGIAELLELLSGLAWVGFGIAGLSIFACCAAQARERSSEIGIRRAVGASLRNTVATLLLEALILAVFALLAGVAIGAVLLSIAREFWPGVAGALQAAGPVPALSLAAVIGAASLTPLWLVRSRHLVEPADREVGLKAPTFQVAVSVALLLAAAALLGGNRVDPRLDSGAERDGLVFQVDSGSDNPAERGAAYAALLERLSDQAGTLEVSLASPGMSLGLGTTGVVTTDCGLCYFGMILLRWPNFSAVAHAVSPDSFRTQQIELVSGRVFLPTDTLSAARVAIVNRQLAGRYFQGGAAVGRDIFLGPGWPTTPYRVIGIVDDARSTAIGGTLQPREAVYLSVLQHPPRVVELLIRYDRKVASAGQVAATLRSTAARMTLTAVADESAYRGAQVRAVRWFGAGFGLVAVVVLLMALLGTFFTLTVWAEAMAWELGLRRALGARKRRIVALVLWRTSGVALGGAALGLFLYASVLAGALSAMVSRLPLADARLLWPAAILPVVLALIAGAVPGIRLLRRPPADVLQ